MATECRHDNMDGIDERPPRFLPSGGYAVAAWACCDCGEVLPVVASSTDGYYTALTADDLVVA